MKTKINPRIFTLYIVRIAMLSAMSIALMYFSFPILPMFPFFKMDFADVPVVLGALAMGPWSGVLIALIKCLLYLPTSLGNTLGIGVLSNFMLAVTLSLVTGYVYKMKKNIWGALIGLIAGVIAAIVVACISNWFLVFPLYKWYMNFDVKAIFGLNAIWAGVIPFNLIKNVAGAAIIFPIYKLMSKYVLKGDTMFGIGAKKKKKVTEEPDTTGKA